MLPGSGLVQSNGNGYSLSDGKKRLPKYNTVIDTSIALSSSPFSLFSDEFTISNHFSLI